jgi:hypothetical protein
MYFSCRHPTDVIADRDEIRIPDIVNNHQKAFRFIGLFINNILRFEGYGHDFPFQQVFF